MSFEYNFVVTTNKYAGNFEREMCAYMTSRFGDCFVGEEIANIAHQEILVTYGEAVIDELDDIVLAGFEDEGCRRPVEIATTPKDSKYYSFAIFMDRAPEPELVDVLKTRAYEFANQTWDYANYAKTPRYSGDSNNYLTPVKGLQVLGFMLKTIETTETFTEI